MCLLQAIVQMINPPIDERNVVNFLVEHLQRDVRVLAASLGRSPDDAILLIHIVLHRIEHHQFNGDIIFTFFLFGYIYFIFVL